ncbi:MAG: hypothetical protein Q9174_004901 [Haloplaca sp. 1 TL-2023]
MTSQQQFEGMNDQQPSETEDKSLILRVWQYLVLYTAMLLSWTLVPFSPRVPKPTQQMPRLGPSTILKVGLKPIPSRRTRLRRRKRAIISNEVSRILWTSAQTPKTPKKTTESPLWKQVIPDIEAEKTFEPSRCDQDLPDVEPKTKMWPHVYNQGNPEVICTCEDCLCRRRAMDKRLQESKKLGQAMRNRSLKDGDLFPEDKLLKAILQGTLYPDVDTSSEPVVLNAMQQCHRLSTDFLHLAHMSSRFESRMSCDFEFEMLRQNDSSSQERDYQTGRISSELQARFKEASATMKATIWSFARVEEEEESLVREGLAKALFEPDI